MRGIMRGIGLRYVLALLGVFALYVAGGKLGLALATVHESATAVWPPTGIAIAACLILGRRVWPAVAAGAFLVNVTTSGDPLSSVGIALGNTLEGVIGAYLMERFANGRYAFVHVATVLRFAAIALVAPVVAASVGVASLVLTGLAPSADAGPIWLTWWLGDVGGAVVVAPLLVLWATRIPELRGVGTNAELAVLALAVAATATFVFTPSSPLAATNVPLGFFVFPVLVWPVVRFGPRVSAAVIAVIGVVAVWGSLHGAGPWVRDNVNASLLLLAAFLIVVSLTSLVVGASVVESHLVEESLRATEERLRLAEERKVEARDEFLSVAAHELKTPLTSLQLATQYLLREIDTGHELPATTLRSAASTLASQTQRLGSLIGQLLDTVRIQSGRMDLQITDQDVAEIARRVAREAQATTTRHEIDVVAPARLVAPVDAVRLEQVLRNLLDNAIKYSPSGQVAVALLPEDGAWLQLSVRDHGPGIPDGARDRIFERFYQARKEDRGGGGLGLGLHVARHIVELHGGTIAADFPPDGGTRIIVRLPARVAPAPELEGALS